jgi:hypothetical protein
MKGALAFYLCWLSVIRMVDMTLYATFLTRLVNAERGLELLQHKMRQRCGEHDE